MAPRLSERLRSAVQRNGTEILVEAKAYVYRSGCRDPFLYLVESGAVKTFTCTANGKTCIVGVHGTGDLFGESALLGDVRREAAAALTATRVLRLPKGEFGSSVLTAGLINDWLVYQAGRLRDQQTAITMLATTDSERRLAATMLMLVDKLGGSAVGRVSPCVRLTHEELAQMVGTTRSRIGYFLKRFERDGMVVSSRRRGLAIDTERLCAYLEAGESAVSGASS